MEVISFQRIFSQLPNDIQRFIAEYVPQIFKFVMLLGKLISNIDNTFILLDSKLDMNMTHEKWIVLYCVRFGSWVEQDSVVTRLKNNEICENIKKYYIKISYLNNYEIESHDFCHDTPWSCVFRGIIQIENLMRIRQLLIED